MTATAIEKPGLALAAFLPSFTERLRAILRGGGGEDPLGFQRAIAPAVFDELKGSRALSFFIPREYGGGGAGPKEVLSLLEAASYESLPLGLTIGINIGLFLQPLTKYGGSEAKACVFRRYVDEGALGGLMLTEPDYGTDLLSMRTQFERRGEEYAIRGTKHWAGLSGLADFWILSARERRDDGSLKRDIDFFLCDSSREGQRIVMEEAYPNLGLSMIPYGRNKVDLRVPLGHRFRPPGSGVRLLLDLLHRSRMSFGGMAVGFQRRLLDEALARCRGRKVGGSSLVEYDQVQRRLSEIQAAVTVSAAFCAHAAGRIALERDLSGEGLSANIHKAVLTDLMQQSAQSLLQLSGAEGYRLDALAGRALVDSRPFQIFEGSNDVLYDQVAAAFLGELGRSGGGSLAAFLGRHELTRRAADRFAALLDFEVAGAPSQRRAVDLGRVLARVAAADLVVGLGGAGYPPRLVDDALGVIQAEVAALVAGYRSGSSALVAGDLLSAAPWQDYAG
jgi:alkylation response protein AidB-like acyl-CoA dehydrogenase